MRWLLTASLLSCAIACSALADEQPCTNGSFEQLDPRGFPIDWSPVGDGVETAQDAHTGQRSLRLRRTRETKSAETGLNRGWRPGVGTATIDRLKGGIDFYYKAVSANGAQLMVYAIPMNQQSVERTASRRAEFSVPDDHVGDGQWHHTRLKYDFTADPEVKWVHFAARITGAAGELLLDDFSYVERTGPILRFGKLRVEEDPNAPGRRCTLRVPVWSHGDEPARAIQWTTTLPDGLQVAGPAPHLADLEVGQRSIVRLKLEGERRDGTEIRLAVRSAATEAETRLMLQSRLEVVSFGPAHPLGMVGRPMTTECVVKNAGNAMLPPTSVTFSFPAGEVMKTVEPTAPGESRVSTATFVATRQSLHQPVAVEVQNPSCGEPFVAQSSVVIGPDTPLPKPTGSLHCSVNGDCAVLENARLRCVFRRLEFGWGPGELYVHNNDDWLLVAQFPRLSRVVAHDAQARRFEKTVICEDPPAAEVTGGEAQLTFQYTWPDLRRRGVVCHRAHVAPGRFAYIACQP